MSKSHHEAKLATEARESLGSRSARALRAAGRIPASLQFEGRDGALCHFSIEEAAFAAARRQEASLFDLDIAGDVKSAVIREIQYDSMGSVVNHVDFKGVVRGQRSDVRISITVMGTPQGTLNQAMDSVEVNCLPKDIPDGVEVNVGVLEPGTQLHAADLALPEAVTLSESEAARNDTVLTVVEAKAAAAEPAEGEGEGEGDAEGSEES